MLTCPQCDVPLQRANGHPGIYWRCAECDGRSSTVALLRRVVPRSVVNTLWRAVKAGTFPKKRHCPACRQLMTEVPVPGKAGTEQLDVCQACQLVWFDRTEYAALPKLPSGPPSVRPRPKVLENFTAFEMNTMSGHRRRRTAAMPEEGWKWIPGLMGMPVERENDRPLHTPVITWGLAAWVTIISLIALLQPDLIGNLFSLVPAQALRYGGLTFLTSFFLHGSMFHLITNMYFLMIFGDNVEDWLGKKRFILLLLCATLAGGLCHLLGDPRSTTPVIGASGGISGIIAFYALTFPRARMSILMFLFIWLRVSAFALFIFWIVMQLIGMGNQLSGFGSTSYLAHLGGAGIGILFWLGGRRQQKRDQNEAHTYVRSLPHRRD